MRNNIPTTIENGFAYLHELLSSTANYILEALKPSEQTVAKIENGAGVILDGFSGLNAQYYPITVMKASDGQPNTKSL